MMKFSCMCCFLETIYTSSWNQNHCFVFLYILYYSKEFNQQEHIVNDEILSPHSIHYLLSICQIKQIARYDQMLAINTKVDFHCFQNSKIKKIETQN